MLTNLHVRNLALIDEADINFERGLNILTGETGAGKSIILGSVNIALGGKASSDIIRKDADYALTELMFNIQDKIVLQRLSEMGVEEIEDGELLISRKIMPSRSQTKVNGQNMTAAQVREIASLLIDIHGQHDNQLLLNDSQHLKILDDYAKEQVSGLKDELSAVYNEYMAVKKELEQLGGDEESRNREVSFMEFEIAEIEAANLRVGEDDELENAFKKMSHSQKIMEEMSVVQQCVVSGQDNVCDQLAAALRALNSVSAYDEQLQPIADTMTDVESLLADISRMVTAYVEECSFNAEEFNSIQSRLDLLNSLKMKYGRTIEDILNHRDILQEKLSKLQNYAEVVKTLQDKLQKKETEAIALARQLSDKRKSAAQDLCAAIKTALEGLNFKDVRFEAYFEEAARLTAQGIDNMCFMIATNPGEELKKLSKVASGGELSRIMLAIRTVAAAQDHVGTLIFDEIDAGISGRTAQMVAEKLNTLAAARQIICITHLPQIAAMADNHFLIEKTVANQVTATNIFGLSEQESINELARMLGGSSITDTVLANAKEMRKLAVTLKK